MLNCQTGHIIPQFHIMFDDLFTTVRGIDVKEDPALDDVDWEQLIQMNGTEEYKDVDNLDSDVSLDGNWRRV